MLIARVALICAVLIIPGALLEPDIVWPERIGHMLLQVCNILTALGIIYCIWVRYCAAGERWVLFLLYAFGVVVLGETVRTVLETLSTGWSGAALYFGSGYYYALKTMTGLLAIAAARDTLAPTPHSVVNRRSTMRALGNHVLSAVAASAMLITFVLLWPRVRAMLHISLSMPTFAPNLMHTIAAGSTMLAFGVGMALHAQRYVRSEEPLNKGVASFLSIAFAAQLSDLLAGSVYDIYSWASNALWFCAQLILLMRLGREFAEGYSSARSRVEHLETVHHLSTGLTRSLDLGEVLTTLVSDTAEMLSATYSCVMLSDEAGDALVKMAGHGLPDTDTQPGLKDRPLNVRGSGRPGFYSGHTARAFLEKRIVVVDDVYTDVEFVPWKLLAQHDGYAVSVPLVCNSKAVGVLDLFFESHIHMNDDLVKLLQTLASAGAGAVTNALLYARSTSSDHMVEDLRLVS